MEGNEILYVIPTFACNRGCRGCVENSVKDGESFDTDTCIEAIRHIGALQEFREVCITGGGEPLMHPAIARIAETSLRLTGSLAIVTSGPAKGEETSRFEEMQDIFYAGSRGKLTGTSEVFWGETTLSVYDNPESLERVRRALDIMRMDFYLRVLWNPWYPYQKYEQARLLRHIGWINDELYRHKYFFAGLRQLFNYRLSREELFSAKTSSIYWDKPDAESLLTVMSVGLIPVYLNPMKDVWCYLQMKSLTPLGRAEKWLPKGYEFGMCEGIAQPGIMITPRGMQYCTTSRAVPLAQVEEFLESRKGVIEEAQRTIIERIRPHHRILCEVCPLST